MFDEKIKNFHLRRKNPLKSFSENDRIRLVGRPPVFITTQSNFKRDEIYNLAPRGYVTDLRLDCGEYYAELSGLDVPDRVSLQKSENYNCQIFHDGRNNLAYVLISGSDLVPDRFDLVKRYGENSTSIDSCLNVIRIARVRGLSFERAMEITAKNGTIEHV